MWLRNLLAWKCIFKLARILEANEIISGALDYKILKNTSPINKLIVWDIF